MSEHKNPLEEQSQEENLSNELNTDSSVPGMQHLNDKVEEESALEKLQLELDEMKDKYLRMMAEFDNFKRRSAKEKNEIIQTASNDVMQALLPVLDDVERADKQMKKSNEVDEVTEGILLVFSKLKKTLFNKGLKKMESLHQDFDADLHEAITEIPAQDEQMKGKILDEIEPGYYLNDKLIRHAKVVIGK